MITVISPVFIRASRSACSRNAVMSTHSVSSSASSAVDFDDAMLTPMRHAVIPPLRSVIPRGDFVRYPQ